MIYNNNKEMKTIFQIKVLYQKLQKLMMIISQKNI